LVSQISLEFPKYHWILKPNIYHEKPNIVELFRFPNTIELKNPNIYHAKLNIGVPLLNTTSRTNCAQHPKKMAEPPYQLFQVSWSPFSSTSWIIILNTAYIFNAWKFVHGKRCLVSIQFWSQILKQIFLWGVLSVGKWDYPILNITLMTKSFQI
jgi:hypothetical protein